MARSAHKDSAGSQFFVMVGDSPYLDGDYAAFGKVIEGMDAVRAISQVKRDRNDRPLSPVVMKSLKVELFGVPYPEPSRVRA